MTNRSYSRSYLSSVNIGNSHARLRLSTYDFSCICSIYRKIMLPISRNIKEPLENNTPTFLQIAQIRHWRPFRNFDLLYYRFFAPYFFTTNWLTDCRGARSPYRSINWKKAWVSNAVATPRRPPRTLLSIINADCTGARACDNIRI